MNSDHPTDIPKTFQIDRELSRPNADIVCLQETRLADSGSICESNFTLFWHGKSKDKTGEHGFGFAITSTPLQSIQPPNNIRKNVLPTSLNQGRHNPNYHHLCTNT
jgi:exonuclease III